MLIDIVVRANSKSIHQTQSNSKSVKLINSKVQNISLTMTLKSGIQFKDFSFNFC